MNEQQTCQVVRDLLPLYLDELVSPGSQELVEAHLRSCEDCQEALRRMQEPLPVEHAPQQELDYLKKVNSKLKRGKQIILGLVALLLLVGLGALVKVYLIGTLVRYTDAVIEASYNETSGMLVVSGHLRDTGWTEGRAVSRVKVADIPERNLAEITVYAVPQSIFHRETTFATSVPLAHYEWVGWQRGEYWPRTVAVSTVYAPKLQMVVEGENRFVILTDRSSWPDWPRLVQDYQPVPELWSLAEIPFAEREEGEYIDIFSYVEAEEYGVAYYERMPYHMWMVMRVEEGYLLGHFFTDVERINDETLDQVETLELYSLTDAQFRELYSLALELLGQTIPAPGPAKSAVGLRSLP